MKSSHGIGFIAIYENKGSRISTKLMAGSSIMPLMSIGVTKKPASLFGDGLKNFKIQLSLI